MGTPAHRYYIDSDLPFYYGAKNLEHFKIVNLSINYSPLRCSNPVWLTWKNIFWRMLVSKQFWFPLTSILWPKSTMGVSVPEAVWVQTFFKIFYFVFHRRKKVITVWNDMRVNKWWQNFKVWVNYPAAQNKITHQDQQIILPLIYLHYEWLQFFFFRKPSLSLNAGGNFSHGTEWRAPVSCRSPVMSSVEKDEYHFSHKTGR